MLSISNAQPGFCLVPDVGNDSVDCSDQNLEEKEKEELLGDPFPELPSSPPSEVDVI